ncbi:DUF3885 domain-containing protein [Thermoactinomyces sp. DSM 45892]|uniref:DUF3885 domain-containing protein n=1 Tax=Thermoactinomyces sp. DSM 45892 TaxID=1882753 RepID=UPI0008981C34|nr:DUF3885 domain-containing protein [Thermoactinomyces sp. DSM 45892]SDZ27251.1 protein of unknown function [Thermoactinomyces sp. DSM 45892]
MSENARELDRYLTEHFEDLELKSPLFYNAPFGIRFELGSDLGWDDGRMDQILFRTQTLFHESFSSKEEMYFVIFTDVWNEEMKCKDEDLVFNSYRKCLSHEIPQKDISKIELPFRYEDDDIDYTITNRYCLKCNVGDFRSGTYLRDKVNEDIYGDSYLINLNRGLIFYFYDDRGMDIVATRKDVLAELYTKYSDWILEYDRKKIDNLFLP